MNANQTALDAQLFASAASGDVAAVAKNMSLGADPNSRHGVDKATPLMGALSKNKSGPARSLLAASDLALVDNDGWTPLMHAASNCPSMIADLAPVSNLMARDNLGRTALMHAARAANIASITALLPLGGFEAKDNTGMSTMDWAMQKSSGAAFAAVRHLKSMAQELDLPVESKPAVKATRRGL